MKILGYDITQGLIGMFIGAVLMLLLMKFLRDIFYQPDRSRRRRQHDDDRWRDEDHPNRRNSGNFMLFLLFAGFSVLGFRMFQSSTFSLRGDQSAKDPALTVSEYDSTVPAAQLIQGRPLPSDDPIPDYVYPDPEADTEEPEPEALQNGYILQTDCFDDFDKADKRAKHLQLTCKVSAGVIEKESPEGNVYAVFIGPFASRADAIEEGRKHNLKGWAQPYENFEPIDDPQARTYKGN